MKTADLLLNYRHTKMSGLYVREDGEPCTDHQIREWLSLHEDAPKFGSVIPTDFLEYIRKDYTKPLVWPV